MCEDSEPFKHGRRNSCFSCLCNPGSFYGEKKLIELSTQLLTRPPTSAGATEPLRPNSYRILKGHLYSLLSLQKSRSLWLWHQISSNPKQPKSLHFFQSKKRRFGWNHSRTQLSHSKHIWLCCSSLVNIFISQVEDQLCPFGKHNYFLSLFHVQRPKIIH